MPVSRFAPTSQTSLRRCGAGCEPVARLHASTREARATTVCRMLAALLGFVGAMVLAGVPLWAAGGGFRERNRLKSEAELLATLPAELASRDALREQLDRGIHKYLQPTSPRTRLFRAGGVGLGLVGIVVGVSIVTDLSGRGDDDPDAIVVTSTPSASTTPARTQPVPTATASPPDSSATDSGPPLATPSAAPPASADSTSLYQALAWGFGVGLTLFGAAYALGGGASWLSGWWRKRIG
jgi:hypothetical protein